MLWYPNCVTIFIINCITNCVTRSCRHKQTSDILTPMAFQQQRSFFLRNFFTLLLGTLPSNITHLCEAMLLFFKTSFSFSHFDRFFFTSEFVILFLFYSQYFWMARVILTKLRSVIHLLMVFIDFILSGEGICFWIPGIEKITIW